MKLLYYSAHPHLSMEASTGYGTHMREMVAAFRKSGVEVKTLVAGDMHQRAKFESAGGKKRPFMKYLRRLRSMVPGLVWESLKDLNLLRFDRSMERHLDAAITAFQPDVVYERIAYLQNSGLRMAKRHKVRHIAEINAPYPEERSYFSGRSLLIDAARTNLRQTIIESAHLIAVSSALKDYFVGIAQEADSKTLVLPNAVNPTSVSHNAERLRALREQLCLGDALIFGFVGSIFPYHGVDVLIEAFTKLPKAPKSKLLIVGDGASLPELKALARSHGILGDVVFTGSVPHRDVYIYIELMDVCCMARSNWYGSPVKIFEYGLLKKPVIAPNVAPVRDVMDDATGILVSPDNEAVAHAMYTLMGDESLRLALAEAWHHRVLTRHTWEASAKKVIDLCT